MEKHEHNQVYSLKSARVFISRPNKSRETSTETETTVYICYLKTSYSEFKLI